jgi:hypothetical protein
MLFSPQYLMFGLMLRSEQARGAVGAAHRPGEPADGLRQDRRRDAQAGVRALRPEQRGAHPTDARRMRLPSTERRRRLLPSVRAFRMKAFRGGSHLPSSHPAGGAHRLPSPEIPLADPLSQGCCLPGKGPLRRAGSHGLPGVTALDSAHHQCNRALLPGSTAAHPAHVSLHRRRQLRAHHLRTRCPCERSVEPTANACSHTTLEATWPRG